MTALEYLEQMIGSVEKLPKHKVTSLQHVFNRMINRGVDPSEFFDELRHLLDVTKYGESTLPKVYQLHTNDGPYEAKHAYVVAFDEVEARLQAFIGSGNAEDKWLEDSSCELVDVSVKGVIDIQYSS